MSSIPSPTSRRFQFAAQHYLNGRSAYSPALIRQVALRAGLDGSQRLLDLGCGPGQISLAFSSWVAKAIAIDPEPAMLEIAEQLGSGIAPNIEYRQGSSNDLDASVGPVHLAVIGRAFHFMDRADTLARLDTIIEKRGAVVLFGTSQLDDPQRPWAAQYRALLKQYSQLDPLRQARKAQPADEDVLAQSPFPALERISVIEYRRVHAEQLRERPRSMSSLSRAHLGDKLDTLMAGVDAILAEHATDGWLIERVESTALIATRGAA